MVLAVGGSHQLGEEGSDRSHYGSAMSRTSPRQRLATPCRPSPTRRVLLDYDRVLEARRQPDVPPQHVQTGEVVFGNLDRMIEWHERPPIRKDRRARRARHRAVSAASESTSDLRRLVARCGIRKLGHLL